MKTNPPEKLVSAIEQFEQLHPDIIKRKDCVKASWEFAKFCWKSGFKEDDLSYIAFENFPLSNGLHVVNCYFDNIIDWTARQFEGFENVPIPFIYKIDEENKFLKGTPYFSDNGAKLEVRC